MNDPVYKNLQKQFVRVFPDYIKVMLKENKQMAHRDVFISHAFEDKASIARPLTDALIRAGFSVWFDEYELKIGDSLRGKIDEGLKNSHYGIVILSKYFFSPRRVWLFCHDASNPGCSVSYLALSSNQDFPPEMICSGGRALGISENLAW